MFSTKPAGLLQKGVVRTCVIFNPTARGEKAQRFRRHLDEIGAQAQLKLTCAPNDARRLAAEAVREGFEVVVAAGGDGTLNEVLNGIADVPNGFESAVLGVLPLGTVNVFARELGLPSRIEGAWKIVTAGVQTRIDVAAVEFTAASGTEIRYFAQLAGAGLDARAIELVQWSLKKKIGTLAYVVAGFQAFAGKPFQITATGGGQSLTGGLVLIGNGKLYGGNFRLFPQADLRDGLLEVCVFPKLNWITLARCGPHLLLRGTVPVSAATVFQAETLTLSSDPPAPLELDGELIGRLPARFRVERAKLRVMVPP